MNAQTRIIPIQMPNRIKTVTKAEDGGLWIHQHSGNTFKISKNNELFQQFALYMLLAEV